MTLTWITLAYLALPLALFLIGWVRMAVGLPLLVFLAISLYRLPGLTDQTGPKEAPGLPSGWALALVAAIFLAVVCGTGPFGHKKIDWQKHDAILNDLTHKPWPVVYSEAPPPAEPGRAALVYYFGYYLPPAAAGKVLGWLGAYVFLFFWSVLGLFLALLWFLRLTDDVHHPFVPLLVFVLAAGLDPVGSVIVGSGFPSTFEWWGRPWQYPSNVHTLLWAPQHAIGGWLCTGLVMDLGRRGLLPPIAGVILATAVLWSPFVSLGLVPFVVYWCGPEPRAVLSGWPAWTAALLILLVLTSFLASLASSPPQGFMGYALLTGLGGRYLLFVVLEAGVCVALCAWILSDERASLSLLAVVAGCLLMIPLYRMGVYNDFAMRVSLPSLFVLWVLCARSLGRRQAGSARAALALVLLVGALGPVGEFAGALIRFKVGVPAVESISAVPVVQKRQDPGIARQYIGDRGSFFFRFLARSAAASD